jgi:hypothetical protein
MTRTIAFLAIFLLASAASPAEPAKLTLESADARMRRAFTLARESNDSALVEKVLELRDLVKRSFGRKDVAAAERLIRDAEEHVGLDPGGKTMLGLPVAALDPERRKQLDGLEEQLAAAMKKEDVAAVAKVVGEMRKLLDNQAGLPDVRKKGEKGKPFPVKPADVADVFLKVIEADPKALKVLSAGVPAADTPARSYASIAEGCLTIRPLVEKHHKDKLGVLDGLIRGCCQSMIALQLADGHFKFPDLRGKNLVIGDAIDKLVDLNADSVKDGWLVASFVDGSSQVDAAECGMALLQAGKVLKNKEWTDGGLKATAWSESFPDVPTWYFNAYSVSLLCAAFRSTGDTKYRDAAIKRYRVGIEPGQSANGRWLDAESARTGNHFVTIRALHDLTDSLTAGPDRESVSSALAKAAQAIRDEADTLSVPMTPLTVRELDRHISSMTGDATPWRNMLELAASTAVQRCTQGGKVHAAVPLPELAAAGRVGEK